MRPQLHLPTGAGTVSAQTLDAIRDAFDEATALAEALIGLADVDVAVIDAPDEAIPQWGVGGYTYGPNAVLLCVDSNTPPDHEHLLATLVHEFHHAMRWRGPGCGKSLRERLASEGLAMLFEEEALGHASEPAHRPYEPHHAELAAHHLDETPADEARWFFSSEGDVPFWFGYSYGYQAARSYSREHRTTAALSVHAAASAVVPTAQGA